jgi:hypothetical protein
MYKLAFEHIGTTVADIAKSSPDRAENACKEMLAGVKGLLGSVGCKF